MILALVLATLNDLAMPESSIYQRHPPRITTPLAFRHFPSDFENERKHLTGKNKIRFPEGPRVPSLVELLLHHLRVPLQGFQPIVPPRYQDELDRRQLYAPLMANTPFYHYEAPETIDDDRPKRRRFVKLPSRVMFITSATLIVVPNSLLGQWKSEVDKHCGTYIRLLLLRRTTPMPPAQELASNYDVSALPDFVFRNNSAFLQIILMTSHRKYQCYSLLSALF